jgi:hypothetical protein
LPIRPDVTGRDAAFAAVKLPAPGDPAATRDAVLLQVDTSDPPLRLFLGEAPLDIATADYRQAR